MSQSKETIDQYGNITFADEVVAIIAGLAATEIKGVFAMTGGIAGGIVEKLGRKNLSKGVKVELNENDVTINLYIIVDYGIRIPEIAFSIQENVKKTVETMTGLNVLEVNIFVQGVNFDKDHTQQN